MGVLEWAIAWFKQKLSRVIIEIRKQYLTLFVLDLFATIKTVFIYQYTIYFLLLFIFYCYTLFDSILNRERFCKVLVKRKRLIVSLNSIIKRIGTGLSKVTKSLTVARRLTDPCNFKAFHSSNRITSERNE